MGVSKYDRIFIFGWTNPDADVCKCIPLLLYTVAKNGEKKEETKYSNKKV